MAILLIIQFWIILIFSLKFFTIFEPQKVLNSDTQQMMLELYFWQFNALFRIIEFIRLTVSQEFFIISQSLQFSLQLHSFQHHWTDQITQLLVQNVLQAFIKIQFCFKKLTQFLKARHEISHNLYFPPSFIVKKYQRHLKLIHGNFDPTYLIRPKSLSNESHVAQ